MAETSTNTAYAAKCYLEDSAGNEVNFRYSGINPETSIETVKTLTQTLASVGTDQFKENPTVAKRAEVIETETTVLSEDIGA